MRQPPWNCAGHSQVDPHKEEATQDPIRDQEEQIFETAAGISIEELYDGNSIKDFDYDRDLGAPGEFPYTRGPYAGMYRKRIWTRRFQVGFGSPKESNERIK